LYPSPGIPPTLIPKSPVIKLKGRNTTVIIDRKENLLVWRGAAEGVLSETDDPEEIINRAINAILKDFPPPK